MYTGFVYRSNCLCVCSTPAPTSSDLWREGQTDAEFDAEFAAAYAEWEKNWQAVLDEHYFESPECLNS